MRRVVALTLALGFFACTNESKQVEEPVTAEKEDEKGDREKDLKNFEVEDSGKIRFKVDIVYFDFDAATLREDAQVQLSALADYLKKHPKKRVKIEGHADNRGSTEYNLALGDNRALSVKNYLSTLGVEEERLLTVSFGEEKPAVDAASEEAWSKNRRCEFTIEDIES